MGHNYECPEDSPFETSYEKDANLGTNQTIKMPERFKDMQQTEAEVIRNLDGHNAYFGRNTATTE